MVDSIFSLDWNTLVQTQQMSIEEVSKPQEAQELVHDMLPQMLQTYLQLEADKPNHPEINMPDADILEEAKSKLLHLLGVKYNANIF